MAPKDRLTRQVIDKNGGASRARTDDLIVANDALSQLSYSPTAEFTRYVHCNSSSVASFSPRPAKLTKLTM